MCIYIYVCVCLKRAHALRWAWYLGALLQHSGVSIHACTPIRPLLAIGFCVYTALAFRNNIYVSTFHPGFITLVPQEIKAHVEKNQHLWM